ncbi:MAG: sugar transferase [Candidatus Pacebacteria bacterium]|nr:sugar transferase [Candidatus Paceibacterota bacterium]
MTVFNRKEPFILLVGDIAVLVATLWLALYLRFFTVPSHQYFLDHLVPFSLVFLVWILVFFIAGLYERQTVVLRGRLPSSLAFAHVANSIIAVLFFYFIPYFGITPKTNLFIYLVVSFAGMAVWRLVLYPIFSIRKSDRAILIAGGYEGREVADELKANNRHGITLSSFINLDEADLSLIGQTVSQLVKEQKISIVIIDLHSEKIEKALPLLYGLVFSSVHFVDFNDIYEALFRRLPESLIKHNWFLANMSLESSIVYDALKRLVDFMAAFIIGLVSLVFYPFVFIATKLCDGGSIFIHQFRIGKNNRPIKIIKFRTMRDGIEVTSVGSFLRRTRIDELPQLWNVVKGDISLIGPRPELPELVKVYEEQIPYYSVRHLVTPGLSGWAQMYHQQHPHHAADVEETRNKLSYDLYYIKNRSFMLDIMIALKTIKTLVTFVGK